MFDAYEVFEDGKLFATFVFVHGLDMPEEILCLAYMALNIVFFRFDPDVGRKVAEIKGALGLTTTLLSVELEHLFSQILVQTLLCTPQGRQDRSVQDNAFSRSIVR
jgi:hypothetical protein